LGSLSGHFNLVQSREVSLSMEDQSSPLRSRTSLEDAATGGRALRSASCCWTRGELRFKAIFDHDLVRDDLKVNMRRVRIVMNSPLKNAKAQIREAELEKATTPVSLFWLPPCLHSMLMAVIF